MKKRTSKQIFAETFLELSRELPIDKITVKKIIEESGLSLISRQARSRMFQSISVLIQGRKMA